jgi:hypothetical protein
MVSSGLLRRVALVRTDVSLQLAIDVRLVFLRSVRRLLVAACVVPSSPIFVTLMKEAPGSSETSVPTKSTRRSILEDGMDLYPFSSEGRNTYSVGSLRKSQPQPLVHILRLGPFMGPNRVGVSLH